MEILNLNLIPGEALPVAHASQFDVGRTIRLNLFNGSSVYTLTSEDTLTLNAKKPDGTIITTPVTHTQTTYVDIATTEQLTACYGKVECELGINTIGTLNFIIDVERGPKEGSVESDSVIDGLEEQVRTIINNMGLNTGVRFGPYTSTDL